MAYFHGVKTKENPTGMKPPVDSGILTVYVGTAAVNMVENPPVNEPILLYSYDDAVKFFGKSYDFDNLTLHEAIDAHFSKFGQAPICLINVLDPSVHQTEMVSKTLTGEKGVFVIEEEGVIPSTFTIVTETPGEYTTSFNNDGYFVITLETELITTLDVTYKKIDPSLIISADIIGGIDVTTGKKTGLELVNTIYIKYQIVPFLILAPKFSYEADVAAVIETKTTVTEVFTAHGIVDISSEEVTYYADAVSKKNENNLNSTNLTVAYPMCALGDLKYNLSTQMACIIQELASANEGIPYISPSNKQLKADSVVLKNGEKLRLDLSEANYLNANGISTGFSFVNGLTIWGNYTTNYPANSDAKDAFIAARLMTNYIRNTLILTYWVDVDDPTNTTLIASVTASVNVWMASLVKRGYLIGGRVEFVAEDNPQTSLLAGKISFKVWLAHVLPAQEIDFVLEVDTEYYNTLFGGTTA